MAFLNRVLDPPSYGFENNGVFYIPSHKEIFLEFLRKTNIIRSKKNWLSFFGWAAALLLSIPLFIFIYNYFSWPLLLIGFVYSMVILGSHGTVYLHRYSTHRAFIFKNSFAKFICKNLVIKIIPEETYVISHHVHHWLSEKPGDPYNVNGGWLYCFLADVTHQGIAKDLTKKDYEQLKKLMAHTGVILNSYESYLKWGSLCHPFFTTLNYTLNWAFWYGVFYLIGGNALATAIFGMSFIWAIGVRTFNYQGHGSGKDRRRDGIDFNRDDRSINEVWPGYVAGEWHNNHHLYPNGARSGFLRYQLDLPWIFIWSYSQIGGISSYRDYKANFLKDYYLPYLSKELVSKKTVIESVKVFQN